MKCAAARAARPTTSKRCLISTRMRWTSELLPRGAPTRRLRRNDLETLRLVTSHQRRTVPTVGGILLFGQDRERHFPDAWIQAGRFHGSDKSVIVDRMEIRLPLPAAVDAALEFVRKHRSTAPRSGPAVARSAGTCPRLQCARLSSTRWRTPTIRNAAHRYASRSSTIDSRSRIRDCCIPSNRRRPATRRVETPQPRDRPRVPRARPDRAMGKRCSADDCGLPDAGLDPPVLEELGQRFRVTIRTARTRETASMRPTARSSRRSQERTAAPHTRSRKRSA